jgi:hypothetical protein
MYQQLHVKYSFFLSDFIETWIFEKHSIIKFHEIPSIESRVVPCFSQFFERAWLWRYGIGEVTFVSFYKYLSESCRTGGKCGDRVRRLLSSYESCKKPDLDYFVSFHVWHPVVREVSNPFMHIRLFIFAADCIWCPVQEANDSSSSVRILISSSGYN